MRKFFVARDRAHHTSQQKLISTVKQDDFAPRVADDDQWRRRAEKHLECRFGYGVNQRAEPRRWCSESSENRWLRQIKKYAAQPGAAFKSLS